jgi:hypothetical protein
MGWFIRFPSADTDDVLEASIKPLDNPSLSETSFVFAKL